MTTTFQASPTKLRSGAWGARVTGTPALGATVRVTTRAGKSWDARVTGVVWTGDGVSVCETERALERPGTKSWQAAHARGQRTGCSCGSREDSHGDLISSSRNCWNCNHDA